MKSVHFLGLLIVPLVVASPTPGTPRENKPVYYFPLASQTAVPIDSTSIESKYDLTSLMSRRVDDLVELIEKNRQSGTHFNDDLVRLKIVYSPERKILVDLTGNVSDGVNLYRLLPGGRQKIQEFIRQSCPDDMVRGPFRDSAQSGSGS